ncbi:ABC transporter permease [Bacillus cereus]|nr:ABC transporter permease [Bacillus cereus]MDA1766871.1 ABC transporter permease [Bacillus cereus]
MKNLLISEFQRIFSRRKTKILLIVFLILVVFDCIFLNLGESIVYDRAGATGTLNNLNFPSLAGKEVFINLSLIIFPILFVDSFNGELASGSYRLICIRPVDRLRLIISKWIAQFSIVFLFLTITFVVSYVYGTYFVVHADNTTFLNKDITYDSLGAFIYTVKFYFILLFISSSILIIASCVSVILSNPVLSFLLTLGIMVGSIYVNEKFSYFLSAGEAAFHLLAKSNYTFYLLNGIIILFGALINIAVWRRKDIYS